MKKEDLKASLGKIKPREELIASTIAKIDELREREERRSWLASPVFYMGLRVAGACCAIALAVAIGISAINGNKPETVDPSVVRTLAEIDTSGNDASNINISAFSLDDDATNGWIIASGNVDSFAFGEISDSEKASGVVGKGIVQFSADNVLERSKELSVDMSATGTALSASVLFYDEESLNAFVGLVSCKAILRITPEENGTWTVLDFIEYSE
jgi:hypothetical protein